MRKIIILLFAILGILTVPANATGTQYWNQNEVTQSNNASITFRNKSDYTLTLKIIEQYGGLYRTVVLKPKSNQVVYFGSTATYKLKI